MKKQQTNIRLTEDAKRLLKLLAEKAGVNQTAYLETLIRETAKQNSLK